MAVGRDLVVAMIEPVGGHGGMDYYDFSLCDGLVKSGVRPLLFTCDRTESPERDFPIFKVYRRIYGSSPAWLRGLRYLRGSFLGLLKAKACKARLAHFHFFNVGALELFNVLWSRFLGLKVVITAHDVESFSPTFWGGRLVKFTYSLASATIAHNQISKQELIVKVGLPDSAIFVIPHGNYEEYRRSSSSRDAARDKLNISSGDFVVLFFGQIKEVKGLDVLIKAVGEVVAGGKKNLRLVIAGKVWKDTFSKYQMLIDENRLSDIVRADIRYIPDSDLDFYYGGADVIVLPYRRIYQSGVVLMAMTFGVPVIVSDIPGMLEVVKDRETGLVFRSGDSKHLAEVICEAMESQRLLELLASNARCLMMEKYGWKDVGEKTRRVYMGVSSTG